MDHLPGAALIRDSEHRHVFVNRKFREIHELTEEETLGKTNRELFPEETAAIFDKSDNAVLESGQAFEVEEKTIRDGQECYLLVNKFPIQDNEGKVTMIGGVAIDITGRKKAEDELRRVNQQLQASVDQMPMAYILWDRDFRAVEWNDSAERIFGYSRNEMIGEHASNYIVSESVRPLVNEVIEKLQNGEMASFSEEGNNIHKDGTTISCHWYNTPLKDEQGETFAILSMVVDITEQKRAEKERREFEEQVQQSQKLESLGLLAGGIAHDFNNLLLGILGNADLARLEKGQSGTERNHIEEIIVSARRAAELCNQLLAYAGKGRFLVQVVDLSNVAEEMAALLEVSISKKAALTDDFARDLPAIEVDVTQLRQVIMNLIMNASDALGNVKGAITVRTGAIECDAAYLGGSFFDDDLPEGRYVFLEVEDSGCGMDEETSKLIFDPFFTSKGMGRGLGLAAVSGIVRGHLGQIRVNSVPGEGTTIRVLLPASEQQTVVVASDHAGDGDLSGAGTILVVDDEEPVRTLCTRILERAGYKVLTAADGREGVEQFRVHSETISAVLLDMTMPNLNGEEAFEEMQRIREDVRVILSSGFTEQETADRFVRKGLAGFIQKPYRSADLILAIRRVLDN